jgi:hypothetical protein
MNDIQKGAHLEATPMTEQQEAITNSTRTKLATRQRQREALELRLAGRTYQTIATTLNMKNRSQAFRAVERAMVEVVREPAEAVLKIELERLDILFSSVWSSATAGDVTAINAALRVMERRSRLLGLDAPARHEIAADLPPPKVEMSAEEIQEILDESFRYKVAVGEIDDAKLATLGVRRLDRRSPPPVPEPAPAEPAPPAPEPAPEPPAVTASEPRPSNNGEDRRGLRGLF